MSLTEFLDTRHLLSTELVYSLCDFAVCLSVHNVGIMRQMSNRGDVNSD